MKTKITRLSEGQIAILEPKGELIGGDETDDLRRTIEELIKEENKKLVIDLGKVHYMNSSALGMLAWAHTNYTKRGGRIVLARVEKNIQNIFVITKLSLVFDIYQDQREAVSSFAK
ncbi:MAG: STAS domain-containing protein [Bacteroidota bacterium]